MSEKKKGLSRRQLLVNIGAFTAGAITVGGVAGAFGTKRAEAAQALPWPYVTLDRMTVMQAAYNNYYVGGCCYAAGKSLVDSLAAAVGTPWDSINPDMFKFGKGGIVSWGTLCGGLNGSLAIIGMVAGAGADAIGSDLIGWYTGNNFPTKELDTIAKYPNQTQTICKSPLCHQSVSIWCYTTGFRVNGPEKKDRCAKVAAECAGKTVELLNKWLADGKTYTATYTDGADYARCFTCHVGTTSKYDNANGRMNCIQCHDDKVTHHL